MSREIMEERRKYKREWMARKRQDEAFREAEREADAKQKRKKIRREDQKTISNETEGENAKDDHDLRREGHQKTSKQTDEERRKYRREWMARKRQDESFRETESKAKAKYKVKKKRENQKLIKNETEKGNTKNDHDLRRDGRQKTIKKKKTEEEKREYRREWMAKKRREESFREAERKADAQRKREMRDRDQTRPEDRIKRETESPIRAFQNPSSRETKNNASLERQRTARQDPVSLEARRKVKAESERNRLQDPARRQAKNKANADAQKKRLQDPARRQAKNKANADAQRRRLQDPAFRQAKNKANADAQRKRLQDPARRQAKNKANADAQRKARKNLTNVEAQIDDMTKVLDKLTEEKLQKLQSIRERNAESLRRKRAQLTEDERIALRAKATENRRKLRVAMSEEERKIFNARRMRKRYSIVNETTTERIARLITQTGLHINKNPNRYQNAGSFIKHAFLDIRDIHLEIERLKTNLKVCVAKAVKDAVKLHVMQKQRSMGCQSLTFVEISPPIDPNNFKTEFHNENSEADPLVDISYFRTEITYLPNQNTTDDLTIEDFTLFTHATPPVDKNTVETNITEKISCTICSKKFSTSIGLTIHQRAHESNHKEFKCSVCPQMFYSYASMTDHYLDVHVLQFTTGNDEDESEKSEDEIKERSKHEFNFFYSGKCSVCCQTFDTSLSGLAVYSRHIISEHSENKKLIKFFTYICSRCEKPHTTLRTLQNHWKRECSDLKNDSKEKIICLECGMQFSNEKSLSSHVLIFHMLIPLRVVCEQCGSEFSREMTLKKHIREVHQAEYKFPCEECGETFQSKQFLRMHIKSVHLVGPKPYKCKICDKSFAAQTSLIIHEGVHTGYNCKMCGKSLNSYYDLCRHRQLVHAQSNSAEGKINGDNNTLPNAAVDVIPNCDICDRSFSSYISLASHKRYSHGNSNFVCDVCEKPFKRPTSLRRHKYTHDTVRRFACSICKQEFRQPEDFFKHRKKKHSNSTERANLVRLISEERCNAVGTKKKGRGNNVSNFESGTMSQTDSEQHPNTLEIHTQNLIANNIDNQIPELMEDINISFEQENSPEPDDYFPEMEFHDEANENEVALPQNVILELKNANVQNTLLDTVTNIEEDSTIAKHAVFDTNTEINHSEQFNKLIDFSRANVPSGSLILTAENKTKNVVAKKGKHKHKVLIEEENRDAFIVDMDTLDLGKVKIESQESDDMKEVASSVTNDNASDSESKFETVLLIKSVSFPQDPYSPCLMVNLKKLLEYKCRPCKKTILTISKREIRLHKRSHTLNVAKDKVSKRRGRPKTKVEKKKIKSETVNNSETVNTKKHKTFECGYCDKKNMSSTKAVAHCKKHHPGEKPIKCKQCPRMFTSIHTYCNHKRKCHNPLKPKKPIDKTKRDFICEICGKTFNTKQQVCVHKSTYHRGQTHKCSICSKLCTTSGNLGIHMYRMHDSSREKAHLCEECGKAFITARELTNHVDAVHKKIKRPRPLVKTDKTHPYSCNVCSIQFVKATGLQHHLKLHDPQRPYACDIPGCGWRFKAYNNLFTHKKGYHKIFGPRSKQAKAALVAAKVNDEDLAPTKVNDEDLAAAKVNNE